MKPIIYLWFSLILFTGCGSYNNVTHTPSVRGSIVDNSSWYATQKDQIYEINVDIPVPNNLLCVPYNNLNGALRPCTLNDIDNDSNPFDLYDPSLDANFTTADFFTQNEQTNSDFSQKGKSTRHAAIKSYKIKLSPNTPSWNNERTVELNKHFYDFSRIRNKLAFNLFQGVPNLPSLKTEFVHLNVNGVSKGVYTRIESYGKEYLINRGWNAKDKLYKAENFWFLLVDSLAIDSSGKPLNKVEFEKIVDIKNGKDHSKLIEMLKALNDSHADINAIISKYFDRDNYLTWLAVNIILGNFDTTSQNFFLLNPLYSDKFYFLPWDYDDAIGGYKESNLSVARWQHGISLWWDSPLYSKFIQVKKNRDDLFLMVDSLFQQYFTKDIVTAKINKYTAIVEPLLFQEPDLTYMFYNTSADTDQEAKVAWKAICDSIYAKIEDELVIYNQMKYNPMPFFFQTATYSAGKLQLAWDRSVDLNNNEIIYDIKIADNVDLNNSIIDVKDYNSTTFTKEIALTPKIYYISVIAKEKNNPSNFQISFEDGVTVGDKLYYGLLAIKVQ